MSRILDWRYGAVGVLLAMSCCLNAVAEEAKAPKWEKVALTLPEGAMVRDIHFVSAKAMYVALRKGGVHHSVDRGETWKDITGELKDLDAISLAAADDGTIVVSAGGKPGGVFRLVEGHWVKGEGSPEGLSWLRRREKALLAYGGLATSVGGQNVYRSTDNGVKWTKIATVNRGIGQVFQVAPSGDLWIGCEASGPYRSTDGGETWTEIESGKKAMNGATFLFPADGSVIYAAHSQLLRWTKETNAFKTLAVGGLSAAPGLPWNHQPFSATSTSDGALWVSTGRAHATDSGFIDKSADHGATWVNQSTNLPLAGDDAKQGSPRLSVLRADPQDVLYVSVGRTALWRTTAPVTNAKPAPAIDGNGVHKGTPDSPR